MSTAYGRKDERVINDAAKTWYAGIKALIEPIALSHTNMLTVTCRAEYSS
jgi:hypothetical protein